ncbi:MAG: 50S ribosomal protein L21 [Legionellales bacterium]|nr:50S ribosomal protein L21 [Legionellales bacterium]
MYAVIKTGGQQFRVVEGQRLKVATLPAEVGEAIDFSDVLMIAKDDQVTVGSPNVAGATVTGEVIQHGRHRKIRVLKFKRRKHHMKRMGHRQNFTEIQIVKIAG